MSKLTTTPPLVDVDAINREQEVEIQLHEPLLYRPATRKKRLGMQALNGFVRLEALLAKEEALASAEQPVVYIKQQEYNRAEIDATIGLVRKSLLQFDEDGMFKKDAQTYAVELGLANLFPKSAKRLVIADAGSHTADAQAHFTEMTVINQLVAIALQLQQDIRLPNHKYMAHQIALLYQCLNQAGGNFLKYKPRVERHFDDIKTLTNGSDEPKLSAEQRAWLSQLTSDVVTEALFSGRPVSAVSQPFATYMTALREVTPRSKK